LGKIDNTNVEFSLEKNGQPINDISNITQALKYTTPVNGIIKLYLYEKDSGELLINPDIITMLTKFFGMDDFKAYDSIENWFGKKYDVYIDTTRPWDW
jgi:hypothetical protein